MYKSYLGLRLSSILLLSQLISPSFQFEQCLVTLKNVKVERDYSFSLAQVSDLEDPLGPQEACYYSCGAQILTQSADDGDMKRLTLLDKSANFLTSTGFLRIDHVYFVNHLGFPDEKGGNGIGCVEIKSVNQFNHYPLSHSVCKKARNAICGFWGKQVIPYGPLNRNGTTISEPNASTILTEDKPTELPDPAPKSRPEPKSQPEADPEPEYHNSWSGGHRGGWAAGRWGGQHHWDGIEVPQDQLNLEATMSYAGLEAPLLDSVITLPVVKYERDPVNGELIEVTKYATFVQLNDHGLTQNDGGYPTGTATLPAYQTGSGQVEKINFDEMEPADEDYEFKLPLIKIPSDVSYTEPKNNIVNNNKVKEEQKDEIQEAITEIPIPIPIPINMDHQPSQVASFSEQEQELKQLEIPIPIPIPINMDHQPSQVASFSEQEQKLEQLEIPIPIPIPINTDYQPSQVASFSEQEQEQEQLEIPKIELASIVHEESESATGENEIINFDALDDLNDIVGEDIITNVLNIDTYNTLLEQHSATEFNSVANATMQNKFDEIPAILVDFNNTESQDVEFSVMGKTYKIIPHLSYTEKSMEQAKLLCMENDSFMSKVNSTDYSELTTKLKLAGLDNIAIGSWNGNDYLLTGPHCLIVQVGLGVFPGECASTSAVMCQI